MKVHPDHITSLDDLALHFLVMSLLQQRPDTSQSQSILGSLRGFKMSTRTSPKVPMLTSSWTSTDDIAPIRSPPPIINEAQARQEDSRSAAEDAGSPSEYYQATPGPCDYRPSLDLGDDDISNRDTATEISRESSIFTPRSIATSQSLLSNSTTPFASTRTDTTASPTSQSQSPAQRGPYPEFEIEDTKGLFALPTMDMSDVDRRCCSLIESRLRDAISNRFKPKKGVDRFYLLDSYMVKTQGYTPKAAIVLTCCNKDNKKQLQKIVRTQRKFDARQTELSKYPVIVHLGEAARRIADEDSGIEDMADGGLHAYVPDNTTTLSGIVADYSGPFWDTVRFTIGGTILVSGVPYLLTAGHPFPRDSFGDWGYNDVCSEDEWWGAHGSEEDDSDETDSDNESLYAIFNSDEEPQHTPPESATEVPHPEEDITWPSLSKESDKSTRIPLREFPFHANLREPWPSATSRTLDHDWALIPLQHEHMQWTANLLSIPGQRFPKEVTMYKDLEEPKLGSTEVWINAGVSGLQKGWLAGGSAFLDFGDSSCEARKIILQKPLCKSAHDPIGQFFLLILTCPVPGDSGAWVISNDHQVCGHIVAAKPSSPWAYMVPFANILQDLQSEFNTEDVRLPSMAAAMVSMVAQATRPPPTTCDQGMQTEFQEERKRHWHPPVHPSYGLLSSYDRARARSDKSSVATVASGTTLVCDDDEWALSEDKAGDESHYERWDALELTPVSLPDGSTVEVDTHRSKEVAGKLGRKKHDSLVKSGHFESE